MERRRTPVRLAGLTAVALLLAGGLGACGRNTLVGRSAVATVNGHDISQADVQAAVDDQLKVLTKSGPGAEKQRAAAKAARTPGVPTKAQFASQLQAKLDEYRAGSYRMNMTGTNTELTAIIQAQIYRDALRHVHGKVTKTERENAHTQVLQSVQGLGLKEADIPKRYLAGVEETQSIVLAIQAAAPKGTVPPATPAAEYEAQLKALYDQQAEGYAQVCISLISTADEASAKAARARIDGGESFASVATDVSLDATSAANGGKADCISRSQLVGVFPDATASKAGDLLGPAQGNGAWVIVKLDSVKVPTYAELRPTLAEANPNTDDQAKSQALSAFVDKEFRSALKRAKVSIDSRYGTWSAKTGAVVAPGGSGATSTTVAAP